MQNKIVGIGSKRIEISIQGKGKSLVVIEPGLGCDYHDWYHTIEGLKEKATILTYYRAGYGKSTMGNKERGTAQIAEDLRKILEKERINEPVILVGHSFGGLCVQQYAKHYPEKVAGMVLVDSNSVYEYRMEEVIQKLPNFSKKFCKASIIKHWKELSLMNKEELAQEVQPKLLPEQTYFPERVQQELLAFSLSPNLYAAMAEELKTMSQSAQNMGPYETKLDIPLKVLGRDKALGIQWNMDMGIPEEEAVIFENLWHDLVKEQVKISSKGTFHMVLGAKHAIYRTHPEVVIQAIEAVLKEKI